MWWAKVRLELEAQDVCEYQNSTSFSRKCLLFDAVGKGDFPVRILSFDLPFQVDQCVVQVYTMEGENYFGYDDPTVWTLIKQETLVKSLTSAKTKLPLGGGGIIVNPGETRAFYFAFLDCVSSWPLATDRGSNYTLGTWVEDTHLAIKEGIKKQDVLTWANPFGIGSDYYCCCAPGWGCSHSMRGGTIHYEAIGRDAPTPSPVTASPTEEPTTSFAPTMQVSRLLTPEIGDNMAANGIFFDLTGKGTWPIRILNFELRKSIWLEVPRKKLLASLMSALLHHSFCGTT